MRKQLFRITIILAIIRNPQMYLHLIYSVGKCHLCLCMCNIAATVTPVRVTFRVLSLLKLEFLIIVTYIVLW